MATAQVIPAPTAWDEHGNPVQPTSTASPTAWDEHGNPINPVQQVGQRLALASQTSPASKRQSIASRLGPTPGAQMSAGQPETPGPITRGVQGFNQATIGSPDAGSFLSRAIDSYKHFTPDNPLIVAGTMGMSPSLDLLRSSGDASNLGLQRMRQPGIMPKIAGGLEYLEGGIPFLGPNLVHAGRTMESGNIAGGIGETLGTAAPFVAPEAAERLAPHLPSIPETPPEEVAASATQKIRTALNPRVGRGGAAAEQMDTDLATAQPHLARIARQANIEGPTLVQRIKGTGNPDAFGDLADEIHNYREQFWKDAHEAPLQRHARMEFPTDQLRQRAISEIGPQDDTAQARLARQWIDREIPKIKTLSDADTKIRLLNADIKTLPEKYGPLGVRVRQATLSGLRDYLDDSLEQSGEQGVRQANREWGALRNIEDRLNERYYQQTGKAAQSSPIPDWMHAYIFAHPGGAAVGVGLRIGRMLAPESSRSLASGLRDLGRSGLRPNPITEPEYVGRRPIGLLPAPKAAPLITPEPESYGSLGGGTPRYEPTTHIQRFPLARIPGNAPTTEIPPTSYGVNLPNREGYVGATAPRTEPFPDRRLIEMEREEEAKYQAKSKKKK